MNGPPLAVYGTLRRWPPQRFRATLQGYFLPASLASALGFHLTGLWTHTVTHLFLIALPAAVVGTLLGSLIHRRLHGEAFLKAVHVGLLVIGAALLAQAIRGV